MEKGDLKMVRKVKVIPEECFAQRRLLVTNMKWNKVVKEEAWIHHHSRVDCCTEQTCVFLVSCSAIKDLQVNRCAKQKCVF